MRALSAGHFLLMSVVVVAAFRADEARAENAPALGGASVAGAQKTPNELAEELLRLRDPFKRIVGPDGGRGEIKSPLERFPTPTFKLVGVQTGPGKGRAVLLDPQGSTHIVGEKVRIGLNNGYVARITSGGVLVKERVHNILGQIEEISTLLELQPESKALAKPEAGGSTQMTEVLRKEASQPVNMSGPMNLNAQPAQQAPGKSSQGE